MTTHSLHLALLTAAICSLLTITSQVSAAYPPSYYAERNAMNLEMKLQEAYEAGYQEATGQSAINTDRFDRLRSGAPVYTTGKGIGKTGKTGKAGVIVQQAPLAYVVREEVALPPLQDTGPALNALLFSIFGVCLGLHIYRKNSIDC